ncbi:hypothetical protein HGRIS_008348 [Hohenbuehelia grisea]|uniref:Uncharacterized protein n=1 Tax=Hohenbuehelia grisea TaxID=104357 RepID=A0ABR3J7Q4_9AGAR
MHPRSRSWFGNLKVSDNKNKWRTLSDEVARGLVDLERLILLQRHSLDDAELWQGLDELRHDLESVYYRCHKYFMPTKNGFFGAIASNSRSWLRRADIEADVVRLERRVQACYFRFLAQVAVSTHVLASRTAQCTLFSRQEHHDRLAQLEGIYDQECRGGNRRSTRADPDLLFLRQQIEKIRQLYDTHSPFWTLTRETPNEEHLNSNARPHSPWNLDDTALLHRALTSTCQTVQLLDNQSQLISLQDSALSLFHLADALNALGWKRAASDIIAISTNIYSHLFETTGSVHFQRYLAATLTWTSYCYQGSGPVGFKLGVSDRAVGALVSLYNESNRPDDLDSLLYTLHCYSWDLLQSSRFDEALDCSQQIVMLHRERFSKFGPGSSTPPPAAHYPEVRWSASGESSVVLSSDRQFVRSSCLAYDEAWALWTLACGLAAFGRYAEAQIAASDALSCVKAVVAVDQWYRSRSGGLLTNWQGKSASWVSVPRHISENEELVLE